MYGLTEVDLELQARARRFTDSLIPHEAYAEAHGGELPHGLEAELAARAREHGLTSTNMPESVGGRGCTLLQVVLVQEQGGRVTNALGWLLTTPPAWWCAIADAHQRETWLLPTVRGDREECYAITEEHAGSDLADLRATAVREGDF
ncbi:MAG: acyl-CoA dehydrogenase family protein, partial [Nocardioides sp.]